MDPERSQAFGSLLNVAAKTAMGDQSRRCGFGIDGKQVKLEQDGGRHSLRVQLFNEGGHDLSLKDESDESVPITAVAHFQTSRFDPSNQTLTFREDWLTDDGRVFEHRYGTEPRAGYLGTTAVNELLVDITSFLETYTE